VSNFVSVVQWHDMSEEAPGGERGRAILVALPLRDSYRVIVSVVGAIAPMEATLWAEMPLPTRERE
jgi:hypothetical protein